MKPWLTVLTVLATAVAPSASLGFSNTFDPQTLPGVACGSGAGVDRWCGTWNTDPPQLPSSPAQTLAPLGQLVLERTEEAAVRAFVATGEDFGDFDFNVGRCTAGGHFYRGTYAAGGKVLACAAPGSTSLYGQYRSDVAENTGGVGAAFRSGYFTLTLQGTAPSIRFTGGLGQWLGGAPENQWSGSCTGTVCTFSLGPGPVPTPTPTPGPAPSLPELSTCTNIQSSAEHEHAAAAEKPKTFCGLKPLRDDVRAGVEGNAETAVGATVTTCLAAAGLAVLGGLAAPPTGGGSAAVATPAVALLGGACATSLIAWLGISGRLGVDDIVREKTGTPKFENGIGSGANATAPVTRRIFLPRPRLAPRTGPVPRCPKAGRARCVRLAGLARRAVSASGTTSSLAEALAVSSDRGLRAVAANDAEGAAIQAAMVGVYSDALADALAAQGRAFAAVARRLRAEGVDVRLSRAQVASAAARLARLQGVPAAVRARLRSDGFTDAQIRQRFRAFDASAAGPLTLTGVLGRPPATAALAQASEQITVEQVGALVRALRDQRVLSTGLATTLLTDLGRLRTASASGRAAAAARVLADSKRVPGRFGLVLDLAIKPLTTAETG